MDYGLVQGNAMLFCLSLHLCSVAVSLGLPIGVTQERLERLALMGLSDFFTDDLDGVRIRVVQNRGINDRV